MYNDKEIEGHLVISAQYVALLCASKNYIGFLVQDAPLEDALWILNSCIYGCDITSFYVEKAGHT